jgi:hypothetical protein
MTALSKGRTSNIADKAGSLFLCLRHDPEEKSAAKREQSALFLYINQTRRNITASCPNDERQLAGQIG